MIRIVEDLILLRSGLGLGNSLGLCRPTSPGFVRLLNWLAAPCRFEVLCTYPHFQMRPKQQQQQPQQNNNNTTTHNNTSQHNTTQHNTTQHNTQQPHNNHTTTHNKTTTQQQQHNNNTTTTTTTTRLNQVAFFFFVRPVSVESPVVDMPVHGEHAGAPRVRRERRMRSFWRHEQMAIQMVLASVQHHSYDRVHTEGGAPRSQNTATRARGGGESREMKYTAMFRKTLPPRTQSHSVLWSVVLRRRQNSWWKCPRSCPSLLYSSRLPSRSSTFLFRVVEVVVDGSSRNTHRTENNSAYYGAERWHSSSRRWFA